MADRFDIDIVSDSVSKALGNLSRNHKTKAVEMITVAASMIEDRAKKNINEGTRSGATYRRGGITHQASGEGEFPKTDTGNLVKNITTEAKGDEVTVGSRAAAPHGYWLEFGTSRMDPRPWLKPSAKMEEKNIDKFLDQALGRWLDGL